MTLFNKTVSVPYYSIHVGLQSNAIRAPTIHSNSDTHSGALQMDFRFFFLYTMWHCYRASNLCTVLKFTYWPKLITRLFVPLTIRTIDHSYLV